MNLSARQFCRLTETSQARQGKALVESCLSVCLLYILPNPFRSVSIRRRCRKEHLFNYHNSSARLSTSIKRQTSRPRAGTSCSWSVAACVETPQAAAAAAAPVSTRHFVRVIWKQKKNTKNQKVKKKTPQRKNRLKQHEGTQQFAGKAKTKRANGEQSETAPNVYLVVRVSGILYLRWIRTPLGSVCGSDPHQQETTTPRQPTPDHQWRRLADSLTRCLAEGVTNASAV